MTIIICYTYFRGKGCVCNNWIASVAMQHAVSTTIEEEVISMGPPRDYINSPVVNQKSVIERKREWSESSAVKEEGFGLRFITRYFIGYD
jgi:hypothetical protein